MCRFGMMAAAVPNAHPDSPGLAAVAPPQALMLAGRRGGPDPVCVATGVTHKALLAFQGVPCLVRVAEALFEAGVPRPVHVSVADPTLLDGAPQVRALRDAGGLVSTPASSSPAASVERFLAAMDSPGPLLVVSSDHALLSAEMLRHFLAEAPRQQADLVVGVVPARVFRARFPDAPRTFVRLLPDAISGANLFWFRSPEALRAARFWTRAESLRKRPWRLAAVFGPLALLRFALGRLHLEQALARASQAMGVRVGTVTLPFAEAAIDVDRPEDVVLVERILGARHKGSAPSAAKQPLSGS